MDRPGSEFWVRTIACRIVGVSSRGGDVPPAEGHPQRGCVPRGNWSARDPVGPHYVGGSIPGAPVRVWSWQRCSGSRLTTTADLLIACGRMMLPMSIRCNRCGNYRRSSIRARKTSKARVNLLHLCR